MIIFLARKALRTLYDIHIHIYIYNITYILFVKSKIYIHIYVLFLHCYENDKNTKYDARKNITI